MHCMHASMHCMHAATSSPAELVRLAREIEKLSQQSFGARFGKSQGVVSRYESGDVDPPAEVLMHCMHVLSATDAFQPSALESAINGVRLALENLGRALDALQRAAVSADDTSLLNAPHSPLTREGSP